MHIAVSYDAHRQSACPSVCQMYSHISLLDCGESTLQFESAPKEAGYSAPDGSQHTVAPIDDTNVLALMDGIDDFLGNLVRLQHHRIMKIAAKQSGINKTWADVRKTDVKTAGVRLLL